MTSSARSVGSLRLTFSYDDDGVRLAAVDPVDMLAPPSDPVTGYDGHTGFWVEVRDSSDAVVYRLVLHDPMPTYHEVHAPSGGQPRNVSVNSRRGTFAVVVPAGAGTHVALFDAPRPDRAPAGDFEDEQARPASPRVGTEPAGEIARFPLDGAAS